MMASGKRATAHAVLTHGGGQVMGGPCLGARRTMTRLPESWNPATMNNAASCWKHESGAETELRGVGAPSGNEGASPFSQIRSEPSMPEVCHAR